MEGWQLQCCGELFAVGDEVAWKLKEPDLAWLERALDPGTAILAPLGHAGRWPEETDELRFDGYLVDLIRSHDGPFGRDQRLHL
ncbi:hypothetical protein FB565_007207 [Actinoplanes lutulentus]|uniref:Uncharacterized protein n=2 Tax=Actinoplanes lutulentus TaxID=1287878 RepID=A0A327ZAS8_9ACTN|nr:DUF6578 domain-containing protein [Actinoplanes lutulentus]MBB2947439.1 hypothetical protein [Actinoplanes lutulentus]RAK36712.1 hypothetical protein B0I29_108302 [Actinoplanes lutulentus]